MEGQSRRPQRTGSMSSSTSLSPTSAARAFTEALALGRPGSVAVEGTRSSYGAQRVKPLSTENQAEHRTADASQKQLGAHRSLARCPRRDLGASSAGARASTSSIRAGARLGRWHTPVAARAKSRGGHHCGHGGGRGTERYCGREHAPSHQRCLPCLLPDVHGLGVQGCHGDFQASRSLLVLLFPKRTREIAGEATGERYRR